MPLPHLTQRLMVTRSSTKCESLLLLLQTKLVFLMHCICRVILNELMYSNSILSSCSTTLVISGQTYMVIMQGTFKTPLICLNRGQETLSRNAVSRIQQDLKSPNRNILTSCERHLSPSGRKIFFIQVFLNHVLK